MRGPARLTAGLRQLESGTIDEIEVQCADSGLFSGPEIMKRLGGQFELRFDQQYGVLTIRRIPGKHYWDAAVQASCMLCGAKWLSALASVAAPCSAPTNMAQASSGLFLPKSLGGHPTGGIHSGKLGGKPLASLGGPPPPQSSALAHKALLEAMQSLFNRSLPTERSTEPLIGWREWRIDRIRDEIWLHSPIRGIRWEGPVLRADGKPSPWDPHDSIYRNISPEPGIHGIYAYNRPIHEWAGYTNHSPMAAGRLALSGTVVVHEHGYRAEIATIQKLYLFQTPDFFRLNRPTSEVVERLALKYQCEVTLDLTDLHNIKEG